MSERQNRLKQVYDYLRDNYGIHTQSDFGRAINKSRNAVSLALNGNEAYLTDKLFRNICEAFPGVFDLKWMTDGEGDMLLQNGEHETAPEQKQQDEPTNTDILQKIEAKLEELNKRVTYLEQIEKISERLDKIDKMLSRENYRIPGMESPQMFDLGIAAENHCDRKKAK